MDEMSFPFSLDDCAEVAERASQRLAAESGAAADYSRESLSRADDSIDRLRAGSVELSGAGFGQLVELGVYVGETIRRKTGGAWKATQGTPMRGATQMPYVLEIPSGLVNPIEKPLKRFKDGPEESCRAMYDAFTSVGMPKAADAAPATKPWWKLW